MDSQLVQLPAMAQANLKSRYTQPLTRAGVSVLKKQQASQQASGVSFLEIQGSQAGQRLDNFLLGKLKGVPKSRIYRIIRKGEVRVNRKREKPEYRLQEGDLIRVPPVRTAATKEQVPPSDSLRTALRDALIYEDEAMLVLNKPAGLPAHGGTGVRVGLIEALRYMHPDEPGLELAHRLDKGTSGCIMLAKSNKVLKNLAAQFKAGQVGKTYHALVEGRWPEEVMEISAALIKHPARSGERFVEVSKQGKQARTRFAILESFAAATLVQANPETGRTHQIRVHAQLAGHPIIGDEKYEDHATRNRFAALGIRRLCLHAAGLNLRHPISGEPLEFSAPYDPRFEAALRVLRQAGD